MTRAPVLLLVAAFSIALAACADETRSPATDTPNQGRAARAAADGVGTFGLVQMGHTAHPFAEDARAWDGIGDDGRFAYLSAPCAADAPVNSNATNLATLNSRLPGARSPASVRMHPLEFEVTPTGDGTGELQGTLSLTVCGLERGPMPEDDRTPDAGKDRIMFDWTATYRRSSVEEMVFDGRFEIRGGSGQYEEIAGSGSLHGYFTCAYVPDDCAERGMFTDVMLLMTGTYTHSEIGP